MTNHIKIGVTIMAFLLGFALVDEALGASANVLTKNSYGETVQKHLFLWDDQPSPIRGNWNEPKQQEPSEPIAYLEDVQNITQDQASELSQLEGGNDAEKFFDNVQKAGTLEKMKVLEEQEAQKAIQVREKIQNTKKEDNRINAFEGDNTRIVACMNQYTLEIRGKTNTGNCYWGTNGWQNIMLPRASEKQAWCDTYPSEGQIYNRLPVVNFESGFKQSADNGIARGYVQINYRVHSNVPNTVQGQLAWMRDRMEHQVHEGTCSQHKHKGEERVMRCLYARHYGNRAINMRYDNKAWKLASWYKENVKINCN